MNIARLKLAPGERIREQTIADGLGVSRSSIREAIRILEKKGWWRSCLGAGRG
ncbi:GntR family transcriptional regulator [Desulfoluna spongiiphila]|uniref:GntR family transcriptional regulator n=1 Tax=Desulfoluna spongiiphila TaxID=419481 RepID=UPI001113B746